MPNDYLQMMEGLEAGNDARFQASTSQAFGINADQAAAAKRVAGYLGVPTAAVEAAPEDAQRQAQQKALNFNTAQAPTLRARYGDADFAKLAHDDSDSLSAAEKLLRAAGDVAKYAVSTPDALGEGLIGDARRLLSGAPTAGAGLYGAAAAPFELLGQAGIPGMAHIGGFLRDQQQQSEMAARAWAPEIGPDATLTERGFQSGLHSAGQNLVTLPAGILTRSQAALLGIMGIITGGQSYGKARAANLSPAQAIPFAVEDATAEVVTERFMGAAGFLKLVQAGAPAGRMFMYEIAKEVPGEIAATLWQNFNEWANVNPTKSMGDFLAEQPAAIAETVIATLVGGTAQIGAVKGIERTLGRAGEQDRQVDEAQRYADLLGKLMEIAAGSKLRGRDAATFGDFVQQAAEEAGHDGRAYVDATTLLEVLNQANVPLEQFAALSPTAAEELTPAAQSGGTVAIPIGDLAGALSQIGIEQQLLPHLRMTEDSLSQEEAKLATAQAQELLQQEAQRLVQQAGDVAATAASTAAVQQRILEQLTTANRFTADVNEAYARLVSSFFTATAQRLGVAPEELYGRYPLSVQAVQTGDAALQQAHPLVAEQVRAWAQEVQQRHGLEKFDVQPTGQALKVSLMVVPDTARGKGTGTAVMQELTEYADKFGFRIVLSPAQKEDGFGTTSRERLVGFYKRFGFVENKAKARDFEISEAMYREPQSLHQGEKSKPPRGAFSPKSLTISLLEKADLSTFLHETGHFFLEALTDMAAQPDAPADITKDMLTVLEWFGVRSLEEWNALPLKGENGKEPFHEKFAEAFEHYLFEGNAPSRELSSLFGRFRAWLTNVYRSLQSFMASYNTQLSDEVRGVFDRLIATQEEIEQAEGDSGFASMLDAFEGKVDPALLEHYKRLTTEASEEAMAKLQARSLRDLRWTVNARSRELRRLSKDVDKKREAVTKEVTAEVDATPEMRAAARLEEIMRASPEVKDARKDWRDRRAAALERAQEQVQAKYNAEAEAQGLKGLEKGQYLAKNRKIMRHEVDGLMLDWEKANPFPKRPAVTNVPLDAIAEEFGFTSGDHMLHAIDAYGSREVAIEGITNQRMLERYGELVTPGGLQRAANEAVHNEARARAVAAEMQALQSAVTAKAPTGKTITANTKSGKVQYQQTTNVIVAAARRFAENLVARRKVKELRANQHQAAERRAAKAAMEAAAKGKSQEAMVAKRDQLLNFYAAKETIAAIDEVEKGVKYLRKVADSETLDPDYRDQIAVMLERFDLRPASNKALERRATLLQWVEEQRDMGVEPEIPPELLDEAQRRSYRDMTVEEFRGLVDTVKQIEHLGRLKHKLLTAKDEREFAAVVDTITAQIIDAGGKRTIENATPNTELGKKLLGLQKFAAQHVKAATWARIMDGGHDGGPVWEYIIRAANTAGDQEVEMRATATRDLTELVAPLLEDGKMDAKTWIPEINASLNRQARIAVALNMGNEGNLQRLMGGHNWSAEQVQAIGRTLTEQEWRFVQKIWDYFDSYRPLVGAKEKRVSGVEPKWVEPVPFEMQVHDAAGTPTTVKLRGGYYPVKYDPEASHRAEQHADAEGAKQQMRGAYTSATTRRSFTKARVDEVRGRPLLLSLDGVYQGVNEVIHDLSWHEFLIDANRLVGNDKIAAAMRQKFGAGAHQQFKSWLQDVARGETSVVGEGFAGWLRSGVSISGLGFNIMSAVIQPLGITQSITRIGAKWVGRGVARYAGAPIATTNEVHEKSSFMRHRAQTRLRELAEVQAQIQGRSKVREAIDVGAYYLMLQAQQSVDIPTWVGAYEKAVVEGGFDEAHAVQLADQAVIDAQGSGMLKDQAAIERGGQMKKLLTVFYSFFNTTLNNAVLQTATETSKAKLAADYLLLTVVPVVLGAMLRDALTPGDSGDWDDWRKMAKRVIGEEISFLMGLMVGVREFTNAAQAVTGTAKYGTDYSGPAGTRMVGDVTKLGVQANQGELDPAFRKALVNVAGELLRLPSAQINRSITGFEALRGGKTHNPLALVTGYQEPGK